MRRGRGHACKCVATAASVAVCRVSAVPSDGCGTGWTAQGRQRGGARPCEEAIVAALPRPFILFERVVRRRRSTVLLVNVVLPAV